MNMDSEETVQASAPRSNPFLSWLDEEAAAVVTILFGLFQVVLAVPLSYSDVILPKIFMLPLAIGILIVASGSFTMANAKNPSRHLLKGCACTNVIGLLGALLAFCLYCSSLVTINRREPCDPTPDFHMYRRSRHHCPEDALAAYCWSLTLVLLIHDCGAIVIQSFLSMSAIKALKTD
ncbi:uncharacterized protein ACB058_014385 isoform 2-T2 [Synchiropus picturatus]